MNKTLYICGDSFCSIDNEYGYNWPQLIQQKCPHIEVVNLSTSGASNYLIYKQVTHALKNKCNYLIFHATSSIRQEFLLSNDVSKFDHIDRYWNISTPDIKKPMACISWLNPEKNGHTIFNNTQLDNIKFFFTEFIDMPVLIEKNYVFIKYTLNLLSSNKNLENWGWSIGGFEHKSFSNVSTWDFTEHEKNHTTINLWDYYDPTKRRPYFHVTNKDVLESICDYYIKKLNL